MKGMFKDFLAAKNITEEQYKEMDAHKMSELYSEFTEEQQKEVNAAIEKKADESAVKQMLQELDEVHKEDLRLMRESIKELSRAEKAAKDNSGIPQEENNDTIKTYITKNSEVLKSLADKKRSGAELNIDTVKSVLSKMDGQITTKGTQGATDIGDRSRLGAIEFGTERKAVRRPVLMDLFRQKNVTKEFLTWWEEDVVTRDAKFVVACAVSTHGTKKSWVRRTIELAKMRDMTDICIDMLDDYDFVESEIRELVEESIVLKFENELLLGPSTNPTDLLSISSVSSVFNPANPLAPYNAAFKLPTIGDLASAMKSQIAVFGQLNKFKADTILISEVDKVKYLHEKNTQGNYLFPNFVFGTSSNLDGMEIVVSPLVEPNTLYIFDSTKGEILNRRSMSINAYFENRDNAEHELVTFVGLKRAQFRVKNVNRDAFMKCTSISAALTAITKP